ncbi:hypothetical protein O6H91_02G155800 [Diphasiastrum complanatum]|uniref:Uncharacterized protein n=1 Tax=Diphasiastrum complanatum TaxID=34168 RepID=A0ACC2EMI3_DIPCM|nr:hypothetical protein O6H91_02G155800 [Diphasiastrum complanatum]
MAAIEMKRPNNYYGINQEQIRPLLSTLLEDPLLADVPKHPSVFDIDALISLELGSAMKLSILKMDGSTFDVVMNNSAKVRDLKATVKKRVNESEQSQLGRRQISWKHVWGNFCLCFMNQKLIDDGALLQDFGIKNNDQLRFVHHLVSRESGKHSHAKKRRFFHGLQKT